MVLLDIAPKRI